MNSKFFGVLVLMAVALVVNVNAQNKEYAAVPFDFMAGDKVLPAASYDMNQIAPNAIVTSNSKDGKATMIQGQPVYGKQKFHSALLFHRYGDRYFLYQVWNAAGKGFQVRESKLEKEQAMAGSEASGPQGVVIALR